MSTESLHHLALYSSPIGIATGLLLVIPTPDKFKKVFVLTVCPLWYVRTYNLVRYIATLNINAGWQPRDNKAGTKP